MNRKIEKSPLLLASGSPRRAKILAAAGVPFTVLRTDAAEVAFPEEPERTVLENARLKWQAARDATGGAARDAVDAGAILAADTIVWFDNRIYGKPRDLAEAAAFLRTLSGQTHRVFTGVAYGAGTAPQTAVAESRVTFRRLSEDDIRDYVARVRPLDRAGAYDIDESGSRLVAAFEGEYENIMGLPLAPLRTWGILG